MPADKRKQQSPDDIIINPEVDAAWERIEQEARESQTTEEPEQDHLSSIAIGSGRDGQDRAAGFSFEQKPQKTHPRQQTKIPTRRSAGASWLLCLLLLPIVLSLLYVLAGYLLVPQLISGPVADAFTARYGWQPSMNSVSYNPFNSGNNVHHMAIAFNNE